MLEILLEKYGPVLRSEELVQLLGYESTAALHNARSAGRFPVPTWKSGRRLQADARDVAEYLETRRLAAHTEHAERSTHSVSI